MTWRGWTAGPLAAILLLGACTSPTDQPGEASSPGPVAAPRGAVADGVSTPVEDSLYPDVGDPGVDALAYHLDLTWDPDRSVLRGTERLRLRSTTDADHLQLDLAAELTVRSVTVDGVVAEFTHDGKDLVVDHAVRDDRRYTLVVDYAGTPRPVPAPTRRRDIEAVGWTTTADGGAWTMQEPYGAYTWYAVNDQPSDKARYSFRITTPRPLVGVANGRLRSRSDAGGRTVTRWVLDQPAAAYLVTVAIADYVVTEGRSSSGTPLAYWTPRDRPEQVDLLGRAPVRSPGWSSGSGPTPSTPWGSSSCRRRARWRRRR